MSLDDKRIVGISIGDINGIGSEIILKTFEDSRMLEFCTPVIFASVKIMTFFKKHFDIDINFHGIDKIEDLLPKKINVLNVWKEQVDVAFGEENEIGGKYALKSLQAAVAALKSKNIDALVTAPINKTNIQSDNFKFPGHTDYLAQELGGESLMLLVSENLRVGLLTDHVAVKDVVKNINRERIDKKINTIYRTLIEDFGIEKPRIAVLGINPHAGDKGVIGEEDDTILRPALDNIRSNGKMVFGPYAADSFFGSGNHKNFDAILASYHDQGLIPFKTLAFGKGVNFTAGLNRIRTSPDHGTAFDLAGKNAANFESFREAVYSAISIFERRVEYNEISRNPLQINRKRGYSKKK
ncbi:4-hydroxythreonine-4-phosphate dehydrogenase PdxA [Aequorivita sp. SDUM287046]|uniref:4-hydroxythreonine-4-phosphate dehydrogenase PdxA n=1 Tax=Aequorivita aurantiaca TaxID=3053356 RepID=A0ABT8DIV8_9FLAO|nr:4-hydroxythreonine-4-phosphate dehydrogenase PdxA [Aequorivita aurantiaca]MDN3723050.1 4-hydroxythreonine-4-phosphate dehydrogenase PdxA [Aequorivita aurantiaca]